MKMSGKTYDVLKFVVWLWVPLSMLTTDLLQAWVPDCTYIEPIGKTLTAIEVFLGVIISKSNYDYNKEKLEVMDDDNE